MASIQISVIRDLSSGQISAICNNPISAESLSDIITPLLRNRVIGDFTINIVGPNEAVVISATNLALIANIFEIAVPLLAYRETVDPAIMLIFSFVNVP